MAAPEDRPEIAKLKDDITIPTALVQLVRLAPTVLHLVSTAASLVECSVPASKGTCKALPALQSLSKPA